MLYVDVDAVSKLAHWNILPLLPHITGLPWHGMASVSSLKHRAHRAIEKLDGKVFHTVKAATIAKEALIQMQEAGEPDVDLLTALGSYKDIDPGEAVLLSLATGDDSSFLLTGDKRALRRLAKTEFAGRFSGRIVVVEQVLLHCLQYQGRDWVLQHVCPHRQIDKAISICLGSTCEASATDIEQGLTSYIGEIDRLFTPTFLRAIGLPRS